MKLNVRLIVMSFVIVLVVSVSSTFIYYSLVGKLISQQQDQSLLNATNDFIFSFQTAVQKPQGDFENLHVKPGEINKINLDETSIDFVFTLIGDSLINFEDYSAKNNRLLNIQSPYFKQFFTNNPNVVLQYKQFDDGINVFYGNILNSSFLDTLSNKIRANIALVVNGMPMEVSNSETNQRYLLDVINSVNDLKFKNNFEIFNKELETSDFVSTLYTPKQVLTPGGKIDFVIC